MPVKDALRALFGAKDKGKDVDLMDAQTRYAVWLCNALSYGGAYTKTLYEKFGSFEDIYKAEKNAYIEAGVSEKSPVLQRLCDKEMSEASRAMGFCEKNHFGILKYDDDNYPRRLKAIKDPPPVLFWRGRLIDFDDNVCIAAVGTRSYTDIGWNSVYRVCHGIAKGGAVIVSGLASGIDTAATRAALDASGYAVGVLGTGIETVYPSENMKLFEEMYSCGVVLTELMPFSVTSGKYFPVRNRIISGLCQGVLMGEGNLKSGAMITARHAAEQGRKIYAIPGDIASEESSGVNQLIRDGAKPVFDAEDILQEYTYLYPHRINTDSEGSEVSVPSDRSRKKVRFGGYVSNEDKSAKKDRRTPSDVTPVTPKMSKAPVKKDAPTASEGKKASPEADAEKAKFLSSLSEEEKKVYELLSDKAQTPDTLCGNGLSAGSVMASLTILEIYGLAEKTEGGFVKA